MTDIWEITMTTMEMEKLHSQVQAKGMEEKIGVNINLT